jgi:formate-dependent nitrite reductase membrane component NrfD
MINKQTSWGLNVVLYMFFSGIGAGVYTAIFLLTLAGALKQTTYHAILIGPIAVIIGLICLLLEVGSPLQSVRIFRGLLTSWMSRGGLIQLLFVLLGFGYALPGFWFAEWFDSMAGLTIGFIGLALALAIAIYHGIALTEYKRVPLWSSSVMPLLSLYTALETGLGVLLILISVDSKQVGQFASIPEVCGIALTLAEIIVIGSLIGTTTNTVYNYSVRGMKVSMIAEIVCLFLALLFLCLEIAGVTYYTISFPISGILMLVGGFIIRYSVLKGGYYLPVRISSLSSNS